jgi:hypothetical protein
MANGKGDRKRPTLITEEQEIEAWERAFGPESTRVQTWYLCPVCKKGAMNYRNPCKICSEKKNVESL